MHCAPRGRLFENASRPLAVVVGTAPGWADPWSRVRRVYVEKEEQGWRSWLVDEEGYVIDDEEVQLARLLGQEPSGRA